MARIGIVAHFAYGALSGGDLGHVGGVERQTSLTARWLAGRGHKVSLITWDEGQPSDQVINGVRVVKMCRRDQGLPIFRFFIPRWSSLTRALTLADADLYYQNCGEYVTGQVAWWCRRHRRKFVYSVASDPDCDPQLPEMATFRERLLYRYGLRRADCVVAQTEHQRQMLLKGFGRSSVVLPMSCEGPAEGQFCAPEPPGEGKARVVWVGRISRVKQLEVLLDVAALLPQTVFEVAGGADGDIAYFDDVSDRARNLANVKFLGKVGRDRMPDVYRGASVLCCTSRVEGFPNTFLEAWSYGVPVVSTVDPDGLIAAHGLGGVAEDARALSTRIKTLVENPVIWKAASRAARKYYLENHALDAAMGRFERVFLETLGALGPKVGFDALVG